jgi:hypothetical protein
LLATTDGIPFLSPAPCLSSFVDIEDYVIGLMICYNNIITN